MTPSRASFGTLGLTLRFARSQVVVGVRGELDLLTAADLGAVVDAVVGRGHATVVLDLGGLSYIGAPGLAVIAATAARLEGLGGGLFLRSTPLGIRRVLDVTSLSGLVHFERPAPGEGAGALGPEQRPGDHSRHVSGAPGRAVPGPGRTVAMPADSAVVVAALRLVVALARATIGGADGASVSLSRHGRVETVAWSDETVAQMDRDQYATGQGPCLSAAAEGHWFHAVSLAGERRWPQFTPKAIEGGIASILSTPLVVAGSPVGALNIYSRAERAFGPEEQGLAALFATQASGVLAGAGMAGPGAQAGLQLQDALRSREVIAQAQGVIMERRGVSAEAAYAALRRSARQAGTPVRRTASAFVASSLREGPPGP